MKSIIGLLACVSLFASCNSAPPEPDGFEVEVFTKDHVHSRYCGHYRLNDVWYYAPSHRHSSSCRHTLENGVWVLR